MDMCVNTMTSGVAVMIAYWTPVRSATLSSSPITSRFAVTMFSGEILIVMATLVAESQPMVLDAGDPITIASDPGIILHLVNGDGINTHTALINLTNWYL